MQNFQLLDIVVFGLVAVVVAFKLYTVLGRRTGQERSPDKELRLPDGARSNPKAPLAKDNVVTLPERGSGPTASSQGPAARALLDIKLADRGFDTDHFVKGARTAYEMIVTAFAHGERETLRPLLSDDVFATFDAEIKSREEKKERIEFAFLALKAARISGAALKGTMAEITVTFDSEVMLAGYDPSGALIEGDAKTPHPVSENWTFARDTFARDTHARDPNWMLIATASGG